MEDQESALSSDGAEHEGVSSLRLSIVVGFFALLMVLIMVRLCVVCLTPMKDRNLGSKYRMRAPLWDRHGHVLASSLHTFSVYAHPDKIEDKQEAIDSLMDIFPHLDRKKIAKDLHSKKSFVWIARHVPPRKKMAVKALGIQGLDVLVDSKRIYHHDRMFSHVLGTTDVDQNGMSGLELGLNQKLMQSGEPVVTSFDLRLQHILYDTLARQIADFQAMGGNGIIIDLQTGEVLAMVSLPDFSPLEPIQPNNPGYFNRNMTGVYEFGSIMKIVSTAMLLETKKGTLRSVFDASKPIYIGRHRVTDFRGQNRPLNVEEAFIYSSNIAYAKMALTVGGDLQKAFFEKMGFSKSIKTDLGWCARPLMPRGKWPIGRIMTAGYGYGFAVTPLHVVASLIPLTTGFSKSVTFLAGTKSAKHRVLQAATVKDLLHLLGEAVLNGQAKKAAAYNCVVGAKTGTANVRINGRYAEKQNLTSAVAVFPLDQPRYGIVVSIDRAKPSGKTHGFATAGWMAAPVISRLVQEIAPLLGVMTVQPEDMPAKEITPKH